MKLTRDMLAGAFLFLVGACFLIGGWNLAFGTATQMGPGYFPGIISAAVMIFGVATAIRSYLYDEGGRLEINFKLRPFTCVFAAVIAFALLINSAGLIVTLAVTVVLSRLAAPDATWRELLGLVAAIVAVIVGVFVYALGVPIQLGI